MHDAELEITRIFAAPRALVFTMWTVEEHFARWFGPHTATVEDCTLDARPGGIIAFRHRFAHGPVLNVRGIFDEVVAPERLRFTTGFVDAAGNPTAPAIAPDLPPDARQETTVLLRDVPRGTEMILRQRVLPASAAALPAVVEHRRQAGEGWTQVLDRLDELLFDEDLSAG